MAIIHRFVALSQVDARRLAVEGKIARAPLQSQQEELRAQKARDAIAKVKDDTKRAILETRRLEAELKAKQQELEKTQVAQNLAQKNEEYRLLAKKIDTLKEEIGAHEIRILEEYERADGRVSQLAELEKASQIAEKDAQAARKKVDAELAVLKAELEKLRAERAQVASGIDKDALAKYEVVLQQLGDSAVAIVQGMPTKPVCGGCFIAVRPNQISLLKGNEQLVTCWQCGRILSLEPSSP
jgi:predicted  nucleic acid-binding Zn-ribbon protein